MPHAASITTVTNNADGSVHVEFGKTGRLFVSKQALTDWLDYHLTPEVAMALAVSAALASDPNLKQPNKYRKSCVIDRTKANSAAVT